MSTPATLAIPAVPAPSVMGWACMNCRYVALMSDSTLQCRFGAPVGNANNVATWATVTNRDWCGDYAPAP